MKKIHTLYLLLFVFCFVKIQTGHAQAPSLSPVQGPSVVCIPSSSGFNYSVSAVNTPTSYTWFIYGANGTAVLSNSNTANVSVSFSVYSTSSTFTLVCYAQNSSGVSSPAIIVINVFETPSVTFSGANSFCQGSSAGISASSTLFQSSSTTISWAPATGLSSTTSPSVTANPPTTTNYTVLVSNGPCTSTNYFLVTVNPLPTVTANFSPGTICKGESSTLTVNGNAITYSVNGTSFSSPASYTPSSTAIFTISSTDANGCHNASQTAVLSVNACTGINEAGKRPDWLNFYPNPNNGSFTIRAQTNTSLMLIDELGHKLRTVDVSAGSETTITGLSPGVYFLITDNKKLKLVVTP